jgi:hypothetical protein
MIILDSTANRKADDERRSHERTTVMRHPLFAHREAQHLEPGRADRNHQNCSTVHVAWAKYWQDRA